MSPEVLRVLSVLDRPLTNQLDYAQLLLRSEDEYLRLFGLTVLLDLAQLPRGLWEEAVRKSTHGMVASKAFKFFMGRHEYALAERVAATIEQSEASETAQRMRAALRMDAAGLVEMHARQFLSDGLIEHLMEAAEQAEIASGWRGSVLWLARATALQPITLGAAHRLLRTLQKANQFDAIEEIVGIFAKGRVFPEMVAIFRGIALLSRKDFKGALQAVSRLRLAELRGGGARYCQVQAEAHEGLGQSRDAFKWYRQMNEQDVRSGLDKRSFMAGIDRLARASYPVLSEDPRKDNVMMVGFPRSGTTLLENALAAHPEVETFQEVPSVNSMALLIDQMLQEKFADEGARRQAFERARDRYYDEIDRRKSKPGARVFVDKMPLWSAWIQLLEKFFPQKRYIFSVRHPCDVVLSCFKQSFEPNTAMENFRTLEDACNLYDRVMSIWFEAFPTESDRVLYVRYDALVTDFESEMRRTFAFLHVPWSDGVLRFAELSEGRKGTTPSYGKVRSGLGIGVQSTWANYRFAFDPPYGKKLDKWVDRFGYQR